MLNEILLRQILENENFRLVFCGGTCLAKAHKLVKRMFLKPSTNLLSKAGLTKPAKKLSLGKVSNGNLVARNKLILLAFQHKFLFTLLSN
jgi:hypothetical protein